MQMQKIRECGKARTQRISRRLYMSVMLVFIVCILLIVLIMTVFMRKYLENQERVELNRLSGQIEAELDGVFTEAEKLCEIVGKNYDIQRTIRTRPAERFKEKTVERNETNGRIALLSQNYTKDVKTIGLFLSDGRSFKYGPFSLGKNRVQDTALYRQMLGQDRFAWSGVFDTSQMMHSSRDWPCLVGGVSLKNLRNNETVGVIMTEIQLDTITGILDRYDSDSVRIEMTDRRTEALLFSSGPDGKRDAGVRTTFEIADSLQIHIFANAAVILDGFLKTLLGLTLMLVVLFVVSMRIFTGRLDRSIALPIKQLLERIRNFSERPVAGRIEIHTNVAEIRELVDGVEKLFVRTQGLLQEREEEQKIIRRAQVAALQEQINPHFLYNTLDSISWLIRIREYEKAQKMLHCFAMLFRLSLSNGRNYVSIQEELNYINYYIDVLNMRYNGQIHYELRTGDVELDRYYLPKLLLQPLVENCIEHGIGMRESQQGNIRISIHNAETGICLEVWDDGVGIESRALEDINRLLENAELPSERMKRSYGIYNVNNRLRVAYGREYGIFYESEYGAYTRVRVNIPLCNVKGEKLNG